jgi:hypothetical protein
LEKRPNNNNNKKVLSTLYLELKTIA